MTSPLLLPALTVVPLQLLAYHIAVLARLRCRPAAEPGEDCDGGVAAEPEVGAFNRTPLHVPRRQPLVYRLHERLSFLRDIVAEASGHDGTSHRSASEPVDLGARGDRRGRT